MVIHHFNRIIRNKWVWGVFAVLISVFFAFDFIFDGRGDDGRSSNGAGELAGETVSNEKFTQIREDVLAGMRLKGTENSLKSAALNKEVWTRLATLKAVDDMGLTATDDEVRDAIQGSFKSGEAYNHEYYLATCERLGWSPERFEAMARRDISLRPLYLVAGSASWVSPLEASSMVRDMSDKITVRIASFQHKNAASIKLDDVALKAYYDSHTNSFALPSLLAVRYVKVPADDPARLAKVEISDEDVDARLEEDEERYGTNRTDAVKARVRRDLKLEKAVEDYSNELYSRVAPETDNPEAVLAVDQLAKLAKEMKLEIKESRPFTISRDKFVPGFMVDASSVLPDCNPRDFITSVSELDASDVYSSYRAIATSNAVYVVGLATNLCSKPRIPTFEEVKGNASIRDDALEDLKAQDFKKSVDKVRRVVLAEIASGKTNAINPKVFGDANVSTSITFVAQTAMRTRAFPNAYAVVPAAMRLAKGELSELIPTGVAGHGVVVYVEDRQPGDPASVAALAQMRESLKYGKSEFAIRAWSEANMARLGIKPSDWTSMTESSDEDDADEAEGSQD